MKNVRGSALLVVIIAFAILMTLGTAVLAMSVSETKQVANQESRIKAHYAARSGAEAMASYLVEDPTRAAAAISNTAANPATGTIDGETFELTVTGTAEAPVITSRVKKNGATIAQVKLKIKEVESTLLDYSVFSHETPTIGKNHHGDIGTNSNDVNIVNHTFPIYGNVNIVGTQAEADALDSIVRPGYDASPLVAEVPIPAIDTSMFSGLLAPGTLSVSTAGTVATFIDEINLSGNDTFVISGGGTVHLMVNGTIALGGNSSIQCQGGSKLVLYSNQSNITFSGTPSLNCVLYAPNARVNINGGGNGQYSGQIICNQFISGNSGASSFMSGLSMDDLLVVPTVAGLERDIYGE